MTDVTHFRQVGPDRWRMKQMAFVPHSGCASTAPRDHTRIDRLADCLADGMTIAQAAERLGVTAPYANAMLQRMRRRLGAQAI